MGVQCEVCPAGTYKDIIGNSACTPCPPTAPLSNPGSLFETACFVSDGGGGTTGGGSGTGTGGAAGSPGDGGAVGGTVGGAVGVGMEGRMVGDGTAAYCNIVVAGIDGNSNGRYVYGGK